VMPALPHVRSELRRVYFGGEKHKLTRHAAYVAAAKRMIALACAAVSEKRTARWLAECEAAQDWGHTRQPERCDKGSAFKCRFHEQHDSELDYDGQPLGPVGMVHYVRVLPRLVRFLKYVDKAANGRAER
jgi:hypothetical protein